MRLNTPCPPKSVTPPPPPPLQAGVTDLVSNKQAGLALSRVASFNQMGIVVGPLVSAALLHLFALSGVAPHLQVLSFLALLVQKYKY